MCVLQNKYSEALLFPFPSLVSVLQKYLEIQSGLQFCYAGQCRHPPDQQNADCMQSICTVGSLTCVLGPPSAVSGFVFTYCHLARVF